MKQLFLPSAMLLGLLLLTACSSASVPQVGAVVPCQIHSAEQVEKAVLAGLAAEHWQILTVSLHSIEARKDQSQMQATIEVVYGYRGFSIEYGDSLHLDYNAETDTISVTYVTWIYDLLAAIEQALKQASKLGPAVKCYGKDTPR